MSITTRELPDGTGFRHTCFICGFSWLSDEKKDARCPKCATRRSPTTRRLARLARGETDPVDSRSSTSSQHMAIEPPDDPSASSEGDGCDSDDDGDSRSRSGSDRQLPVVG